MNYSGRVNAKAELADFVMNHLQGGPMDAALGTLINGLAAIGTAFDDAQERKGNWGTMLSNLRGGAASARSALEYLRQHGGPGLAALLQFADRHVRFAQLVADEILRLQANESTPV